ncbi:copper homeostasis membrane protein CopD [Sphingopyxis sp. QXT-31]|uniref:copper homeostasis membrane protein CopD n=1 Tax=Sphingopyxis sp. QXT-31 TaxID=1357916 RepID=UPI001E2DF690|nr:copper homeostasis membrane protein CopD [Sphingopyxis sp. QXT-31]
MLVMGLAAFLLHALRADEREDAALVAGLTAPQPWLCGLALLVSLGGMLVLTANMLGVAVTDVGSDMPAAMAFESDAGKAWIVRTFALAVAAIAATRLGQSPVAAIRVLALAGAVALASLVWSGHAAATEGLAGTIHRLADALHFIAAGIWLGAIAAFLILLRPVAGDAGQARLDLAARSLDRFARVSTLCVLTVAATGLVNLQAIVGIGRAGQLLESAYGQLLVAKLLLFAAMLGFAALNRWRLVPAPALVGGASTRAIRTSLALEALAAALILALVAALGQLEP